MSKREPGARLEIGDEVHQGEYHRYELMLAGTSKRLATVTFDRVEDDRGGIWCEVSATVHFHGGDSEVVIPPSRTNLMNATRSGWRAHTDELESRYSAADWYDTFRSLVTSTITAHRDGGAPVALDPDTDPVQFEPFLLEPIVAGRGVTVLYGEGGMGKSLLGLAIALSVASGWPLFNAMPLRVGPVVYFDYEDDSDLHDRRLAALMAGANLTELKHPILHKSLIAKVASSQATMRRAVADAKAELVVLDSIGMGRGGDAHGPEDTIRLFRALRSLDCPVLALDHVSHQTRTKRATQRKLEDLAPYGSVYTVNSARLLWGGLVAGSTTNGVRRIQMINTKANHVRKQDPFGITIQYKSVPDKPQLFSAIELKVMDRVWDEFSMTTWERIVAVLAMGNEFLSVKELAQRTDVTEDTVRKELNRHRDELEQMANTRPKRVRLKGASDGDDD